MSIGQHEGSNVQIIESNTRSNQFLPTTPIPWDALAPSRCTSTDAVQYQHLRHYISPTLSCKISGAMYCFVPPRCVALRVMSREKPARAESGLRPRSPHWVVLRDLTLPRRSSADQRHLTILRSWKMVGPHRKVTHTLAWL